MEQEPLTIFLSPHFDDIPLSCGGIAARLARMGSRCICIVVFAAPAPQGLTLSPFAQGMHDQWERDAGASMQAINEIRRAEDRAAARLLNLEQVLLDLPDAPYRMGTDGRFLYASDSELFGTAAVEERRRLAPYIAEKTKDVIKSAGGKGPVRVFAPLGVGHHVDHQLAFWAARRLGPRFGTLYYEDYPYASRAHALETRLSEIGLPAQPLVTPISDLIGVKIASIARYKSQLGVLFGSNAAMPVAVRAYFQSVAGSAGGGEGDYAERAWRLPPVYTLRRGN
ncbi:MAG TPA: PIG-L family deacetylase [Chloroflexia bacterium]|nr:PIG-L family deacetylase [Chloroflexia bacterium]